MGQAIYYNILSHWTSPKNRGVAAWASARTQSRPVLEQIDRAAVRNLSRKSFFIVGQKSLCQRVAGVLCGASRLWRGCAGLEPEHDLVGRPFCARPIDPSRQTVQSEVRGVMRKGSTPSQPNSSPSSYVRQRAGGADPDPSARQLCYRCSTHVCKSCARLPVCGSMVAWSVRLL